MHDIETINRMAVVLLPSQAYLDWTRTCPDADPNLTLQQLQREATVYLLPQTEGDPEKHLRRHFKPIFAEELFAWHTDEARWPKDLSCIAFRQFFEVRFASCVFDLSKGPIVTEGEDE